jgi:hypothetical protein
MQTGWILLVERSSERRNATVEMFPDKRWNCSVLFQGGMLTFLKLGFQTSDVQ